MTEPKWLTIARGELGTAEIVGPRSNARVEEYLRVTSIPVGAIDDQTPWCAAFVGWCLREAGEKPSGRANARSYLNWGRKLIEPVPGCVVVLTRGKSPVHGHVGFWLSADAGVIQLLGGNQSNRVSIAPCKASRVLGYRWPVAG